MVNFQLLKRGLKYLEKKLRFPKPKPKLHGSLHHIVPTSIGGPDEEWNIYRWNRRDKHPVFHELLKNFPSSVQIKIIEGWSENGKNGLELDKMKMGRNNFKAWRIVFNGKTPEEVIEFIKKNFLPAEIRFLNQSKA